MDKIPHKIISQRGQIQILEGKLIITKWERINNKRSHSHLIELFPFPNHSH